jgi:uncharacterized protein (DUF885 family)
MADDTDRGFTELARATLDGMLEHHPEWATLEGDHRHDGRLTVGTAAHYDQTARWAGERLTALAAIDPDRLAPQNRVDAQILANRLAELRFSVEALREHEWNPLLANPGRAIYPLLARDFAPLPDRLRSVAQRLAALPEVLSAARAVLGQMPEVHIETALIQFAGTRQLINNEVGWLAHRAGGPQPELGQAILTALEAIDQHTRWLKQRLADGRRDGFRDPRIGADLFDQKLRLVLDTDRTAAEVLSRAEADLERVTAEIESAAAGFGQAARNDVDGRDGEGRPEAHRIVRAALDSLAADAADDATIRGLISAAFGAQREFVAAHDLVTIFGDPVEVIEMPEINRGVAVAYCDPPGPLEARALATFIAVSPTPESWSAERVRSFYREYNRHQVHNLMIHEGMPGHALQLEHSRRFTGSTPVRAVLRSGAFVEGWAVYVEEVMTSIGYPGEGDPAAIRLQRLKMLLRSIINSIMDVRVHCDSMTEQQAMAMMTGDGYLEDGEATGKWRRVLLTSAQLSTYYVGFTDVRGLAGDLRRAHGDWSDRRLHDAMLAHGSPPARHLRTLLGIPEAELAGAD